MVKYGIYIRLGVRAYLYINNPKLMSIRNCSSMAWKYSQARRLNIL